MSCVEIKFWAPHAIDGDSTRRYFHTGQHFVDGLEIAHDLHLVDHPLGRTDRARAAVRLAEGAVDLQHDAVRRAREGVGGAGDLDEVIIVTAILNHADDAAQTPQAPTNAATDPRVGVLLRRGLAARVRLEERELAAVAEPLAL